MKHLFITVFMLVAVIAQAQIKTKSEYQIGKIGLTQPTEVVVRILTIDGVVDKLCVFQMSHQPALVTAITEVELETMLRKIDEIKIGNMDLNSDYFEKSFTILTTNGFVEIGYYIKTKLDATKGQQWFIKIKDGIYEGTTFASQMDIYKMLGKTRTKMQSIQ
jgi:hypothetical protein